MLKYYKTSVKYNDNVEYGIGISTGWKDTEIILDKLSEEAKEKIVACGNLYTANGINYIIANLYLNPHITELILIEDSDIKKDIAKGIQAFIDFLKTGKPTFELKFEFTEEQLNNFVSYYRNHTRVVKRKDLEHTIKNLEISTQKWCIETEIAEKELNLIAQIPSEKAGFQIHANTIYEGWERAIKIIQTYGFLKLSDYDEQQLELINLSITVRNEDLEHPSMEGIFGINKKDLNTYGERILSAAKPDGLKYTYGYRLRNQKGVDQLQYMIDVLKDKSYTRRAVSTLWVPEVDSKEDEVPCLNLYQAIVQGEYLYFTSYIRANDVLNGWPTNVYGILKIQEQLCQELGYKRGYVTTIAGSAHIYERDFGRLIEYFQDRNVSFCEEDERGYFTVNVEENQIKVRFYSKKGEELRNFSGTTAEELRNQCALYISNINHAIYLGQELMKAELALQNNINYTQDKKLSLIKNK